MFHIGIGMKAHDDVLPLVDVRNQLLGIVLKAQEEVVTVMVMVGGSGELVLDAFPGGEVGGVLVAILPDGAPAGEDGGRSGGADLVGSGEAALEDAADHQGMGLGVEGVELGGDVGFWVDVR